MINPKVANLAQLFGNRNNVVLVVGASYFILFPFQIKNFAENIPNTDS